MSGDSMALTSEKSRPLFLVVLVGLVGDDFGGGRKIARLDLGVDPIGDADVNDLGLRFFFARRLVDQNVYPPLATGQRLYAHPRLGFHLRALLSILDPGWL